MFWKKWVRYLVQHNANYEEVGLYGKTLLELQRFDRFQKKSSYEGPETLR